tara:strand:+ start:88 stop:531 length:444 start_codon:yes stop_codon:yes gene_type:complete
MDKRVNNGGARKGAGRKKGIGISFTIKKHCEEFIFKLLRDDAIKHKILKEVQVSLFEDEKEDYLYIIKNNGLFKIGYSSDFSKRFNNYRTHLGVVDLIYLHKGFNCFELEAELHSVFDSNRNVGEWFNMKNKDILKAVSICSKKLIK